MTQDKVLEKLAKIKAHMESAEKIGSEAEAQAFSAKLQELLLTHKLSMADVEGFGPEVKDDPIIEKWVDNQVHGIRTRRRRVGWMEFLAHVVSKAYCCRFLVSNHSSRISFVGTKSDIEVCEYMFVTLVRLAEEIANKENKRYQVDLLQRGISGGRGSNSGFRPAFLTGFCGRLDERLRADRQKILQAATCTALVPLDKLAKRIDFFMDQFGKAKGNPLTPAANAEGYLAGRKVADSINLNPNILPEGQEKKVQLIN